jgi:plasmid stabilization system protein ParE
LKVILLPQAQEDLDAIFDPLLSRIVRRLQLLKAAPELGAPMMGRFQGYRSTVVGMFRIVYRIRRRRANQVIEVAYIRHCRRAPLA